MADGRPRAAGLLQLLWVVMLGSTCCFAGFVADSWQGHALAATDFEVTMGTCGVPVPQAFTCRTMPQWRKFLESLQNNAAKGFPPDIELFQLAEEILQHFQDKPYPPQDFYKYLCNVDATWPPSDHFCLFGFVGALIIRSRHLMLAGDSDEAVKKAAEMDFGYATTVLGKEGSVDFLDSSPWPVSILDAYLNINETEFLSYGQYNARHPVQPPAVPLESLHWQRSRSSLGLPARVPARILAAVVGTHATLSLEPVDMLRRFAEDTEIRAVFFGLEQRWCEILGMCDQGTTALSQLFKHAEKDPYAYSWTTMFNTIAELYDADENLRGAELLICTEPLAGCLMLRQVAAARGRALPLLGYFGVALLNSCPPADLKTFWRAFADLWSQQDREGFAPAALAVNNLILSEQIYYQTGRRMPYVRAHGLYTGMSYAPASMARVLMWRAPLFMYSTTRCAMARFMQGMPDYLIEFQFMEDNENVAYTDVVKYKAVTLLPWDHALMTFYEMYSANIPLLMPAAEWMYRFLYQRGQLSVGERMYQSIMPGHTPPHSEHADAEEFQEKSGPVDPKTGMASAKAARGVAEDMLTRGLAAPDLDSTKQYLQAALELVRDMRYFLTVAENRTHEDSSSSMGFVRRTVAHEAPDSDTGHSEVKLPSPESDHPMPWHPYTPFQMSPRDANDHTRMRKGGWWLRRGVRFDAMRYWYQFSDFARFPGLLYFENLPQLICMAQSMDVQAAAVAMRRHNEATLVHSASFWTSSLADLMGHRSPAS